MSANMRKYRQKELTGGSTKAKSSYCEFGGLEKNTNKKELRKYWNTVETTFDFGKHIMSVYYNARFASFSWSKGKMQNFGKLLM